MNDRGAMEYIEKVKSYGSVPGLDSIKALCHKLDNPQNTLKVIHIAGTNGKGSVLSFVSTILKEAGYKTGRYISPTIFEYRERIQVNGRKISKADFCECLELVKSAADCMVEEGMPHPTIFEIDTAMALVYFQKVACEIVVLETGLGGQLDATNLVENTVVAVLTPIGLDHMELLGNTLTQIAGHKVGIIKEHCIVVTAPQEEEVLEVICRKCKQEECKLIQANPQIATKIKYGLEKQRFSYGEYKGLEITLIGKHQIENAVLALEVLAALKEVGYIISEKQLRRGLLKTVWPGRFQIIAKKPIFLLDGAHNRDGARRLAESIQFYFTNKRIFYIIGVLKEKEVDEIIRATYSMAEHIITVTPPNNPRGMRSYDLAMEVKEYHERVTVADSLEEAVELSYLLADKNTVIIAFGSLSYLGDMTKIVENRQIIRSDSHGKSEKN